MEIKTKALKFFTVCVKREKMRGSLLVKMLKIMEKDAEGAPVFALERNTTI